MYRVLVVISVFMFSFWLHAQEDVLEHEVVFKGGKAFFQGKPLNGNVYSDDEAPNECKCTFKASYANGLLHGWKKEWYPNGRPKFSGKFSHGEPVGTHVYYYESGKVKKKEKYVNGTLTERTLYYSNGKPKKKEKYANGNLISATLYNRDGTPKGGTTSAKTTSTSQVRQNTSTGKNPPAKPKHKTQNVPVNQTGEVDVNSLPDGLHRFYFADGKTKRVIVKSEGLLIKDSLFYPSGNLKKVLKYNFGELIHTEEYNSDGKLLREQNFSNNKKHGIQIENYADGSPHIKEVFEYGLLVRKEEYNKTDKLINEENYSFGKPHGFHKKFDDSGALVELKEYNTGRLIRFERYENGQKQVLENEQGNLYQVKVFNDQGQLLESGQLNLETGVKEGLWLYYNPQTGYKHKEEYYENGKLLHQGEYLNNKKSGTWIFYSKDKQKEKRIKYKNGVAIDSIIIRYDLQIKKFYHPGDYILYHPVFTPHKRTENVIVRFNNIKTVSEKYIKNEILKKFKENGFNKSDPDEQILERELSKVITFDSIRIRLKEKNNRFITYISIQVKFNDLLSGKTENQQWVITPLTNKEPHLKSHYVKDKKKAFFKTLENVKKKSDEFINRKMPVEALIKKKREFSGEVTEVYLNISEPVVQVGDHFQLKEEKIPNVIIKVTGVNPKSSVGRVVKGGKLLKQYFMQEKIIVVKKIKYNP